jgi:hypothetical protein
MSIDRIGKGGPQSAPPTEKTGSGRVTGSGQAFEVNDLRAATAAPEKAGAIETSPTALDRWRSGEIDLNAYLDLKVNEATSHLAALPAVELEAIKGALRERIANDPMLVELVRTATGHVPDPSGDR